MLRRKGTESLRILDGNSDKVLIAIHRGELCNVAAVVWQKSDIPFAKNAVRLQGRRDGSLCGKLPKATLLPFDIFWPDSSSWICSWAALMKSCSTSQGP